MKEQIIQIPDTLEIKEIKDGKIILVEKEKKLTYKDVAIELFKGNEVYFIDDNGNIKYRNGLNNRHSDLNNCTSKKQAEKLLAINQLMNVAKYLNGDWQPDWNNKEEGKYYISFTHISNNLFIECVSEFQNGGIYFKSRELVQQVIDILGEETIKLALCTDY